MENIPANCWLIFLLICRLCPSQRAHSCGHFPHCGLLRQSSFFPFRGDSGLTSWLICTAAGASCQETYAARAVLDSLIRTRRASRRSSAILQLFACLSLNRLCVCFRTVDISQHLRAIIGHALGQNRILHPYQLT